VEPQWTCVVQITWLVWRDWEDDLLRLTVVIRVTQWCLLATNCCGKYYSGCFSWLAFMCTFRGGTKGTTSPWSIIKFSSRRAIEILSLYELIAGWCKNVIKIFIMLSMKQNESPCIENQKQISVQNMTTSVNELLQIQMFASSWMSSVQSQMALHRRVTVIWDSKQTVALSCLWRGYISVFNIILSTCWLHTRHQIGHVSWRSTTSDEFRSIAGRVASKTQTLQH